MNVIGVYRMRSSSKRGPECAYQDTALTPTKQQHQRSPIGAFSKEYAPPVQFTLVRVGSAVLAQVRFFMLPTWEGF